MVYIISKVLDNFVDAGELCWNINLFKSPFVPHSQPVPAETGEWLGSFYEDSISPSAALFKLTRGVYRCVFKRGTMKKILFTEQDDLLKTLVHG